MKLRHNYDKLYYGWGSKNNGGKEIARFFRLNENIQAVSLRVIGPNGEQLGILTKKEALNSAKEFERDLVEIAPNADPPVAKIIDFQKVRYAEKKKQEAASRQSGASLKELWLSPRIAEHDLQVRLNRAEEFLKNGDKVKLTVKFKGREMAHQELGHKVLDKALAHLGDKFQFEREKRFVGRNLSVIIARSKGSKNEKNEDSQINSKENQNNRQGQATSPSSAWGGTFKKKEE